MSGILYMHAKILENAVLFEKGLSMISKDRKEKINTLKNPISARLSLGAGILLQIALDKNGYGKMSNQIKYGNHGKPYIENIDFYFNLSHSGEFVVCVYDDKPLGVDLQRIKSDVPKNTKKILSEQEILYLHSLNEDQKVTMFYRIWAAKESLIKWDGRGLRIPLNEHTVIEDCSITDTMIFDGNRLFFQEFDFLMPDYAMMICSEKESFSAIPLEITSDFLTKY